jgi:hypothetical protein
MHESPPPGSKTPLGADLVLPGLAVIFAAYFFYSVWDFAWEAKANAVVIGATLLVLIVAFLVRLAVRVAVGEASLSFAPLIEPRRVLIPRLAIVLLTALFVFAIPYLGLTLGLFLLTAALMAVLRAGSLAKIAATSGIIAISAYLLFIALLNSRLPRGPVEKLLALLF